MADVTGQGQTYNLPNYVGELYHLTPNDTPFLSMIGGINGGAPTQSPDFTWQTVENVSASQDTVHEGVDATFGEQTRAPNSNVTQIHQEGVQITYTKQAATDQLADSAFSGISQDAAHLLGMQPVQDELSFQMQMKLEKVARDVEYSFLQGAYNFPNDTTGSPRQTRGMINAISSNTTVDAATTDLSKDHIQELMRALADEGAPMRNMVVFANAEQRQNLSEIYGYAPESRNMGGLSINQIETDFSMLGVVYDRHMPTDEVFVLDVSMCRPRHLMIPGKGFLFSEPLAKSGSYEKYQLYGEIGLEYGPGNWHGRIQNLTTS